MYLLDTNAISELRKVATKTGKADKGFERWANNTNHDLFYLSQITISELRKGVLLVARKDYEQSLAYEKQLNFLLATMNGRLLSVSDEICWKCAETHIPNPKGEFDSLIASTALIYDLTVVTRNVHDFIGIDNLRILNPFKKY